MDSYSRNVERLQRMLQECDVLSDAEDDSEGESDFVIEDEVISDSECYDSEHDKPEKQPFACFLHAVERFHYKCIHTLLS